MTLATHISFSSSPNLIDRLIIAHRGRLGTGIWGVSLCCLILAFGFPLQIALCPCKFIQDLMPYKRGRMILKDSVKKGHGTQKQRVWGREWDGGLPSQTSPLGMRTFSYMGLTGAINITQNCPLICLPIDPSPPPSFFPQTMLYEPAMQDMVLTCGCNNAVSDANSVLFL